MDVYNLDGREYGAITRECYNCGSTAVSVKVGYECFRCGRNWEALRNDEGLACYGCGFPVWPKDKVGACTEVLFFPLTLNQMVNLHHVYHHAYH